MFVLAFWNRSLLFSLGELLTHYVNQLALNSNVASPMLSHYQCLIYPPGIPLVPENPQELGHREHWCLRLGHLPAPWCPSRGCRPQVVSHQGPGDQEPGWYFPRDTTSEIPKKKTHKATRLLLIWQKHKVVFSESLWYIYLVLMLPMYSPTVTCSLLYAILTRLEQQQNPQMFPTMTAANVLSSHIQVPSCSCPNIQRHGKAQWAPKTSLSFHESWGELTGLSRKSHLQWSFIRVKRFHIQSAKKKQTWGQKSGGNQWQASESFPGISHKRHLLPQLVERGCI